jgi:hypothetical protein
MDADLLRKLDPQRFPNMSLPMAAILGFVLERQFTTPVLTDVQVTPDSHVLGRHASEGAVRYCKQHFLYFFPLPQGQGSLRPIFFPLTMGWFAIVRDSGAGIWVSASKDTHRFISATVSSTKPLRYRLDFRRISSLPKASLSRTLSSRMWNNSTNPSS